MGDQLIRSYVAADFGARVVAMSHATSLSERRKGDPEDFRIYEELIQKRAELLARRRPPELNEQHTETIGAHRVREKIFGASAVFFSR